MYQANDKEIFFKSLMLLFSIFLYDLVGKKEYMI